MIFRHAELYDVKQMKIVRHLVKENVLSDPSLVPDKDVAYYICGKGKGWVCEIEERDEASFITGAEHVIDGGSTFFKYIN